MVKKIITAMVAILVINLGVFASVGDSSVDSDFAKIKQKIAKMGTGPDAKIEVKLKDGKKLQGYVSEIGTDHFVVTDPKTKTETPVPYPQVRRASARRQNIILAIGIAAIVVLAVVVTKSAK